jgi:hypothetical protein
MVVCESASVGVKKLSESKCTVKQWNKLAAVSAFFKFLIMLSIRDAYTKPYGLSSF